MASTDLVYRFLGIDAGAGAQFDRMAGKTALLGKTSSRALTAVKGLGVAAAATAVVVGVESVKAAANFQTALARIHTQADASNATVGRLRKGILDMTGAVATAPEALAQAAFHIASVGQNSLSSAQQLDILKISAEGAKIGGADLVDVTNALDAAVVSGIRGVSNYSQAMGVLNATVGAGDMQMQDLADAFGPLGAVMKGYNVSIRQVGAALATFGDNNLRGAEAGTSLRMAVQALAVPMKSGRAILQSWGIASGSLANKLRKGGLTSALDTLYRAMKRNGVSAKEIGDVLTQTFGKRAGVGLSVLMGELDRFHNKLGEVNKGATGFASSWKGYTKTFGYAWDRMRTSVQRLMIELGTKLLPTATRFVNWITDSMLPAVSKASAYIRDHFSAQLRELGANLRRLAHNAINFAKALAPIAGGMILAGFKALSAVVSVLAHHSTALRLAVDLLIARVVVLKTQALLAGEGLGRMGGAASRLSGAAGPLAALAIAADTAYSTVRNENAKAAESFTRLAQSGGANLGDLEAKWLQLTQVAKTQTGVQAAATNALATAMATGLQNAGVALESIGQMFSNVASSAVVATNAVVDFFNTLGGGAPAINPKLDPGHPGQTGFVPQHPHLSHVSVPKAPSFTFGGGAGVPMPNLGGGSGGSGGGSGGSAGTAANALHTTAQKLVKSLAKGLIDGWKGFSLTVKDSMSTGTSHLLDALGKQFQAITDRLKKAVEDARKTLHDALKKERQYVNQMMSDAALSNVPTTASGYLENGGQRLTSISGYLGRQANLYSKFARALKRLANSGLSKALVNQIAEMGPVQGLAYAQQILSLASPSYIKQLNSYERQIHHSARDIGEARYRDEIRGDRHELRRQTNIQQRMEHHLSRLAEKTGREVARHLGPALAKGLHGQPGLSPHEAHLLERDLRKLNRRLGKG